MPRLAGRARYAAIAGASLFALLFVITLSHRTSTSNRFSLASFSFSSSPSNVSTPLYGIVIPEPDPRTPPPRILLVSAFFPLAKSKHSMDDYASWLRHFLAHISGDLYMFCSPEVAPLITTLRGDLPITLNTTYTSPFDIPPLHGMAPRYEEMHAWDREKDRHSPELYAVWNAKPFFLAEALRTRGVQYDYAFWNDAGSLRNDHVYRHWPDPRRVQAVFDEAARESGTPQDELIFFPISHGPSYKYKYYTEDMGPADTKSDFVEGTFFGGPPAAIAAYETLYFAYHDAYLARDMFVGKDQTLINQLLLLFPEHFFAVWLEDPAAPAAGKVIPWAPSTAHTTCGTPWFYYQWWLASTPERERMADIWFENYTPPWYRSKARCGDSRLWTINKLLQQLYGNDWAPHPAHIGTWGG